MTTTQKQQHVEALMDKHIRGQCRSLDLRDLRVANLRSAREQGITNQYWWSREAPAVERQLTALGDCLDALEKGRKVSHPELAARLAGAVIGLDQTAARLGLDLGREIREHFDGAAETRNLQTRIRKETDHER